ncbi:MAG: hypothetical protein R2838_02605 [Caldilineaceae bacterium]
MNALVAEQATPVRTVVLDLEMSNDLDRTRRRDAGRTVRGSGRTLMPNSCWPECARRCWRCWNAAARSPTSTRSMCTSVH